MRPVAAAPVAMPDNAERREIPMPSLLYGKTECSTEVPISYLKSTEHLMVMVVIFLANHI